MRKVEKFGIELLEQESILKSINSLIGSNMEEISGQVTETSNGYDLWLYMKNSPEERKVNILTKLIKNSKNASGIACIFCLVIVYLI